MARRAGMNSSSACSTRAKCCSTILQRDRIARHRPRARGPAKWLVRMALRPGASSAITAGALSRAGQSVESRASLGRRPDRAHAQSRRDHADQQRRHRQRTRVRISFRARWRAGANQLHTRLYFNRLARTTLLEVPARNGTPGRRNSRFGITSGRRSATCATAPWSRQPTNP